MNNQPLSPLTLSLGTKTKLYDQELLKFTEELKKKNPKISQSELAIEAGYFTYENGKIVPLIEEFFDNLLNIKIRKKNELSKVGAKPKFKLKVGVNEQIIIGKSYIRMAKLKPNTLMRVTILERGKIILQPIYNRGENNE